MLAIGIRFPFGRFHANPHGYHPNDGQCEWPPSPWRLTRALVGVALHRALPSARVCNVSSDALWGCAGPLSALAPADADGLATLQALIASLAGSSPRITVPPSALSHVRAYQPKGSDGSSLVHDAFRVIAPDAPVVFEWPDLDLRANERALLDHLLLHLAYFGRAESVCEASVLTEVPEALAGGALALPDEAGRELLLVGAGNESGAARARDALEHTNALKTREQKGLQKRLASMADAELLLRCILRSADDDRTDGLSVPLGARWQPYTIHPIARAPVKPTTPTAAVHTVEWALDTTNPSRAVLPPITAAVAIAEQARRRVLGAWGRIAQGAANERLSGHQVDGTKASGHRHVYWLPVDRDGDGRIDRIVATILDGAFTREELRALASLRTLEARSGDEILATMIGRDGSAPRQFATVFRSQTPFLPPFFHATHGRSGRGRARTVTERLLRELVRNGFVGSKRDVRVEELAAPSRTPWTAYQTQRDRRALRHGTPSGFRIRFAYPLPARPFALGVHAHFGMGVFVPERSISLLSTSDARAALGALAQRLPNRTRIIVVGGAAMALAYGARVATQDVDVVVAQGDRDIVLDAARAVAHERGLPEDWLSDSVARFMDRALEGPLLVQHGGVSVFAAPPEQLLGMKLAAWRDEVDIADARSLLRRLAPDSMETAWTLVGGHVPAAHREAARYNLEDAWELRD